jgi:hypothetical protein
MTLTRIVALIIKPIAAVAVAMLAVSPALAAGAPKAPPVILEQQPPCSADCADVSLELKVVPGQCVWAQNISQSPRFLTLNMADGTTMQYFLRGSTSYYTATAPFTPTPQCASAEKQREAANNDKELAEAEAGDVELRQKLQACSATATAAEAANLNKDEYYETGSRPVLGTRRSENYPIYWLRLKNGASCINAFHDIKSYAVATAQTIGSWIVSAERGTATAVVAPAAITVPAPAPGHFEIVLAYERLHTVAKLFVGSTISFVTPDVTQFPINTVFHLLADGKEVGQLGAGFDLTTIFGADLAGLVPVQKISVIINSSPTGNTTLFAANLQQTAAAIAAMKAFAEASDLNMATASPVH